MMKYDQSKAKIERNYVTLLEGNLDNFFSFFIKDA